VISVDSIDSDRQSEYVEVMPALTGRIAATQSGFCFREVLEKSPRWSWIIAIVVLLGSAMIYLIVSIASAMVAMLISSGSGDESGSLISTQSVGRMMRDRSGFALTLLIPQLSLLILPVFATLLAPQAFLSRLMLRRGHWPLWGWIAAIGATPLIALSSSIVLGLFQSESEQLTLLTEVFRFHATSGFLVPLILLVGLTPAICEEILFRGFLQPLLIRLTRPGWGILFSAMAFALFHLDPVHVVGVFPLGLWLGYLSYQSGSLIPAMLAHLCNNVLSILLVMDEGAGVLDLPSVLETISIVLSGILGLAGVAYLNRTTTTSS